MGYLSVVSERKTMQKQSHRPIREENNKIIYRMR